MSEHLATVRWKRSTPDFSYDTYDRDHEWTTGGGVTVAASSAPEFKGSSKANPEEALVAALSSCHMLTFLALAARKRWVVDSYVDEAVGHMEKNAEGKLAITRVELRPRIAFGGEAPSAEEVAKAHAKAHEHCFIANSVKCEVALMEPAGA